MQRFAVVLTREPDDGADNATVPALPGRRTWGATIEDALARARDAIAVYLADEDTAAFAAGSGEASIAAIAVEQAGRPDAA